MFSIYITYVTPTRLLYFLFVLQQEICTKKSRVCLHTFLLNTFSVIHTCLLSRECNFSRKITYQVWVQSLYQYNCWNLSLYSTVSPNYISIILSPLEMHKTLEPNSFARRWPLNICTKPSGIFESHSRQVHNLRISHRFSVQYITVICSSIYGEGVQLFFCRFPGRSRL